MPLTIANRNVHAIILDLDYCLFDTDSMRAGIGQQLLGYVRERGGFNDLSDDALVEFLWRTPPADVVAQWQLLEIEAAAFRTFYQQLPVPPESTPYADVVPALAALRYHGVRLFLVTAGVHDFQWRKIRHAKLAEYFVDIRVVGAGEVVSTKLAAIEQFVSHYGLSASETLVIGDGAEELAAGRALGLYTVQTVRPGIVRRVADRHVTSLDELFSE
jgi:putative hydrolase of the HAD superfamily